MSEAVLLQFSELGFCLQQCAGCLDMFSDWSLYEEHLKRCPWKTSTNTEVKGMDTRQFTESEFVTVQFVRDSPSKELVITSGGSQRPDDRGRNRFECAVEIDGKAKMFRPNKETLSAMQKVWGFDSMAYMGKKLNLTIIKLGQFDAVFGTPATA